MIAFLLLLASLSSQITIAPPSEPGERLVVTGTITRNGRPAPNVVLYLNHTNAKGIYPKRGNETGEARQHGYLQGAVRSDARGRYRFETIRPGSYPGRIDPAHIHVIVREPGRAEYWIDDFLFDDDPKLTPAMRRRQRNIGGSGIMRLTRDGRGVWHGVRHIVLP